MKTNTNNWERNRKLLASLEISRRGIAYHSIITEYKNGRVTINKEADDFEQANRILRSDEEYRKRVEEYCIAAYKNEFRRYYALILGMDIENRENLVKFAQHRINGDRIM